MRLMTSWLVVGAALALAPRGAHACFQAGPPQPPTLPESGARVGPLPLLVHTEAVTLWTEDGATELAVVSVEDEPLSLAVAEGGEALLLFRPAAPLTPGAYLVRFGTFDAPIEVVDEPPPPTTSPEPHATLNPGDDSRGCNRCGPSPTTLDVRHGDDSGVHLLSFENEAGDESHVLIPAYEATGLTEVPGLGPAGEERVCVVVRTVDSQGTLGEPQDAGCVETEGHSVGCGCGGNGSDTWVLALGALYFVRRRATSGSAPSPT